MGGLIVKKNKRLPKLNSHNLDCWIWKKNKNGKMLLVRRGADATDLPDNYGQEAGEDGLKSVIAQMISNGSSFHKLSMHDGFPHTMTMYRWYNNDPEFKKMVDEAKKIRATLYHDNLQEVAETVKEGNAKSYKVKADIYKHLMAVGDKDQYGQQTKIVGDPNAPISFIVDTGIRRAVSPPTINVESVVIDDGPAEGNIDGVPAEDSPERDPSES